ncbi:GNAT family N-acetyltransferase [Pseudomonas syringae]|uniref:GNAT family N-acetyltransferase n=1 Tax=Pseudomonas syringae TaxID=317 RepID=UPI001EFDBA81|nr:GNAT family N-acetyltransferase [Pseudomonas syringae]MDU8573263.1 GNAT family N-acetyltransferase [Pseudomonas syringae]
MENFEPVRDFFQPRAAKALMRGHSSLSIRLVYSKGTQRLTFPFPGTERFLVAVRDGKQIGHLDYTVNPLDDRVYINKVEIAPEHQHQGVGQALVWHLWQSHQIPIIPIYEYGEAVAFWTKIRSRFKAAGANVLPQLRTQEQMDEESLRWQHLVPEPEHERGIRELRASPEWPAIKARMEAEYGICAND